MIEKQIVTSIIGTIKQAKNKKRFSVLKFDSQVANIWLFNQEVLSSNSGSAKCDVNSKLRFFEPEVRIEFLFAKDLVSSLDRHSVWGLRYSL